MRRTDSFHWSLLAPCQRRPSSCATSVLSTSCVLFVADAALPSAFDSESIEVSPDVVARSGSGSTTNRICFAVIWSFTLCAGASREGSSEPLRPRPDMRRANERAEPLSANGGAGFGSNLAVIWSAVCTSAG